MTRLGRWRSFVQRNDALRRQREAWQAAQLERLRFTVWCVACGVIYQRLREATTARVIFWQADKEPRPLCTQCAAEIDRIEREYPADDDG